MIHTHAFTAVLLLLSVGPVASSERLTTRPAETAGPRALTLEDRVAAQTAIERVYWEHRDWPKENSTPKPSFEAAVTESAIRAKVADSLEKSAALESILGTPITHERLQAEIDRIAGSTERPRLLRELFAALGDDPALIAEIIARPIVADRLARAAYASDDRLHGEWNRRAGPFEAWFASVRAALPEAIALPLDPYLLPALPAGTCTDDSWTPTATSGAPLDRSGHSAVWTGTEMIVWGGRNSNSFLNAGSRYDPATASWTPTSTSGAPTGRFDHSAVWTGTEMIVWGGGDDVNPRQTGGRYNPVSDSWISTTLTGAPTARRWHFAFWTGSEMLVWGGDGITQANGSLYNPATNSWHAINPNGGLATDRIYGTAVWTGTEMIVLVPGTATRYNLSADAWTTAVACGPPTSDRWYISAVWTGVEMILWGGVNFGVGGVNTGCRYNPSSGNSVATSTVGAPSARYGHTAVWTGEKMIVWAGRNDFEIFQTGGRYSPASDSWEPTTTAGAPTPRTYHTAVWTGQQMIVWGAAGNSDRTGGVYCSACASTYTHYRDLDHDGRGNPSATVTTCEASSPTGYVSVAGDCDDSRASVYAGAPQLCDGLNNDCDDPGWPAVGASEADADGDGYRVCQGDCDDTRASVRPGASQLCNGVNDNCSDPSWPTVPASEADSDGDGYRICAGDCNDADPAVHPAAAEVCNGINDDCNGQADDSSAGVDSDADGIRNACDNCPLAPNPTQLDSDGDHAGNACDNCTFASNPDQADTDGDGYGTACDNCPLDFNVAQADADADRVGDVCDNCPLDVNASQSDSNHDGEGDACDLNDGSIWEWREDKTSVSWQAENGPTSWNLYIGDLEVLKGTGLYTQLPGSNALAGRHCGETSTFADDPGVPVAGKVSFSLVTGVTSGTEGGLGSSSSGPRPNVNPCP